MSIITLNNLVKRYGNNIAVDNVNLKVNQGEIFGLLGPNGAGKSTTIKMIMGLLKPNAGEVFVDKYNVEKQNLEAKRLLGLVPQELAVFESLSARENVQFFGGLYGLRGKELDEKIDQALEFTGLKDRQKEVASKFSGGMKRRLNIACAIVHQPQIIIMDEPTVGIDPQSRNHILDSVRELNRRGATIIYTSHYMEEVEAVCSRVGIIDHGKLIACGTKEQLKEQIGTEKKILIELKKLNEDVIPEIKEIPGVVGVAHKENKLEVHTQNSHDHLQDILFVLGKWNLAVRNIGVKEPDLESLFLELTGKVLRD
ncbi:ABC transporter ATP-binding protein [Alkalicella caledoniensis]|uniref:ABC transporter ATP-binding protein n=1 Tax=Alkalicella caledoniensis TaxID=2731377 RepID=A0A7G9WA52_ALKCA|nr:ABC transporter ATP-binding protein [Alkalicella caledoniensis]QNO15564.1 ABC transporter ATP-binding protein [Alkalicella caledoniensis]